MKYGIICAMKEEIELLTKDIICTNTTNIGMREYIQGNLYGKDVIIVMSRIGKVAAAITITTLINRFDIDAVIFCGTAGGVSKDINVGDVVVAKSLVQHDFSVGDRLFNIPMINKDYFETDSHISKKFYDVIKNYINNGYKDIPDIYLKEFNMQNPNVVLGIIASGDQFVCTNEKNDWLRENIPDITCVEMEGASVAQVCYEFNMPFVVFRVISDSANNNASVDFDRFAQNIASYVTRGIVKSFLEL